jgi:flagellar protein FlaI
MDKALVDLQNEILNRVSGRLTLALRHDERYSIVTDTLSEVCGSLESKLLVEKIKTLGTQQEREKFIKDFLALDLIDGLLKDHDVEDIVINFLAPIFVHTSSRGLVKTDKRFESRQALDLFIKKLIVFSGRTELKRVNNLELPNMEGRANIILSPLGPQITITKIKEDPLSIIDLVDRGTLTFEMAGQLWLYAEGFVVLPANIIISGSPGSGKTTFLNALLGFVPRDERLVVIEDTLELNTKLADNCSRLESDEDLPMDELVKNSLRMRPDRIIVGEVRGLEAQGMMTAMNIGKHCMGTIHANNARETIFRLQNEPMNIPESLIGLIDVFIIMRKYRPDEGVTRVVQEIVETAGLQERKVLFSYIWEYDAAKKIFTSPTPSSIYRDKIASIANVHPSRIIEEVNVRTRLLKRLKADGIHGLKEVSEICNDYRVEAKKVTKHFKV